MKSPLHAALIADGYGQQNSQTCAAGLPLPRTDKRTELQRETFPIPFQKQSAQSSCRQVEPSYFFISQSVTRNEEHPPLPFHRLGFAGDTALLAFLISNPTETVPRRCIGPFQKSGDKAVP